MRTSANTFTGNTINVSLPDIAQCPLCHHAIEAIIYSHGFYANLGEAKLGEAELQIVLRCPRQNCHRLFIARYAGEVLGQGNSAVTDWELSEIAPMAHKPKELSTEVKAISSQFVLIFDQASAAEAAGLDQICGPGYRKALEFLIKDYLKSIAKTDDERDLIEAQQLGACIDKRVSDPRLRSTASRAAWIGNDETHYVRRWENKDLTDLKKLIELTVHWISSEILTAELEVSMPDSKKAKP
jgi:hypothetical protein